MKHPPHNVTDRYDCPVLPAKSANPLQRWRLHRECYRNGGHWWHPEPGTMIDWFCCQCGQQTDGMPKDGSRW